MQIFAKLESLSSRFLLEVTFRPEEPFIQRGHKAPRDILQRENGMENTLPSLTWAIQTARLLVAGRVPNEFECKYV